MKNPKETREQEATTQTQEEKSGPVKKERNLEDIFRSSSQGKQTTRGVEQRGAREEGKRNRKTAKGDEETRPAPDPAPVSMIEKAQEEELQSNNEPKCGRRRVPKRPREAEGDIWAIKEAAPGQKRARGPAKRTRQTQKAPEEEKGRLSEKTKSSSLPQEFDIFEFDPSSQVFFFHISTNG